MRRTLVTGGAGFIGSHLVDALVERGDEVIVLDNFSSGRITNLAHLEGKITLIPDDVISRCLIDSELRDLTDIYHLACPASPVAYQASPIKTLRTCFEGTLNMLALAQRNNARILFTSTSEVYGDPEVHPQHEDYNGNVNPTGPRACYDEGKRVAETLCTEYSRIGVAVRMARIFNTYGPRMQPHDGRVVSNFIRQALNGEPLTIYGDGTQTRSFCYVSDMVRALMRRMDFPRTAPMNLGNPGEFTMNQLASMVLRLTGSASGITVRPRPMDDPTVRKPDISLAKRALGWIPTVQLEEGLEKTIAWFDKTI